MASLIKSSMALKYGQLPASLHYLNPNPNIDFNDSPFVMNTKLTNIVEEGKQCTSQLFHVGGTNACVILESAPTVALTELAQSPVIVPLSARSKSALTKMKQRLADHLKQHPETNIADLAYTMQLGRKQFEFSTCVVGDSNQSLIEALETAQPLNEIKPKSQLFFYIPWTR